MSVSLRDTVKTILLAQPVKNGVHNPPYKIVDCKKLKKALTYNFYEISYMDDGKLTKQLCISEHELHAGDSVKWIPLSNGWWHVRLV